MTEAVSSAAPTALHASLKRLPERRIVITGAASGIGRREQDHAF